MLWAAHTDVWVVVPPEAVEYKLPERSFKTFKDLFFMSKLIANALVAQGGGPTMVINQSLVGAILEAKKNLQIERIYGAHFGVQGIVKEDFVDLKEYRKLKLKKLNNTLNEI